MGFIQCWIKSVNKRDCTFLSILFCSYVSMRIWKSLIILLKFFALVLEPFTSVFILTWVSLSQRLIFSMNCRSTKWYLNFSWKRVITFTASSRCFFSSFSISFSMFVSFVSMMVAMRSSFFLWASISSALKLPPSEKLLFF